MFEQSVLIDHGTNKSWSVLASLSVQLLLVTVALAIPLIFTDRLPQFHWLQVIGGPLPPAPSSAPREPEIRRSWSEQPPQIPRAFVAPSRIPRNVPQIIDEP